MRKYIFVIISVVIFVILQGFDSSRSEAIFFDVGQGDAFAFRTPEGKVIVSDGGPDLSVLPQLAEWLGYGHKQIDFLILSHDHDDHNQALVEIAARYNVSRAVLPQPLESNQSIALIAELEQDEAEITYLREPHCFDLEDDCRLCLYPPETSYINLKDLNDSSLALHFDCGGLSVMAAGDLNREGEKRLSDNYRVQASILKISHHGSDTSSDISYIEAVSPLLSVISVGLNNSYGHPAEKVINRIVEQGSQVWRTDQQGALHVYSKNRQIFFESRPPW